MLSTSLQHVIVTQPYICLDIPVWTEAENQTTDINTDSMGVFWIYPVYNYNTVM